MQYRDGVLWAVESWRGKKAGWQMVKIFIFKYDAESWVSRVYDTRNDPQSNMRVSKYTRAPNIPPQPTPERR